jgi:hypothetical protein
MNLSTIPFLALVGKANKQPSFIDTLLNGEGGEMKKTRLSYEFVKLEGAEKLINYKSLSSPLCQIALPSPHFEVTITKLPSPLHLVDCPMTFMLPTN